MKNTFSVSNSFEGEAVRIMWCFVISTRWDLYADNRRSPNTGLMLAQR